MQPNNIITFSFEFLKTTSHFTISFKNTLTVPLVETAVVKVVGVDTEAYSWAAEEVNAPEEVNGPEEVSTPEEVSAPDDDGWIGGRN